MSLQKNLTWGNNGLPNIHICMYIPMHKMKIYMHMHIHYNLHTVINNPASHGSPEVSTQLHNFSSSTNTNAHFWDISFLTNFEFPKHTKLVISILDLIEWVRIRKHMYLSLVPIEKSEKGKLKCEWKMSKEKVIFVFKKQR